MSAVISSSSTEAPVAASAATDPAPASTPAPAHERSFHFDPFSVRETTRRGLDAVEHHPYRVAAIAALAGLAVGVLIARR